jgi:phosphatidate cytidylyltransferase
MSNLTQRLCVAALGIPLLVTAVWIGDPILLAVVLIAGLVATCESLRLVPLPLATPYTLAAYGGVTLYMFDAQQGWGVVASITAALVIVSQGYAVLTYRPDRPYGGWVWSVAAGLYIGLLLSHYLLLRRQPHGAEWVLLALITTFANDTAAYAAGRLIGRRKLAPLLSPNKTWEGATAALLATTLIAPALAALMGLPVAWHSLLLGPVLSVAAQVGDLAKSVAKRKAGVKDCGHVLPVHGGVLDRADSLLFVAPLIYYYAVAVSASA